jgi:hypothetical protein
MSAATIILSITGWAWTVGFGVFLYAKLRAK